ncbi:TetR/AcrR family transcriptional regulator [Novosphingobium malaysiense]|nr:TetR/AcrR family transcriptional regulator [Novosphingobium malaysiense]
MKKAERRIQLLRTAREIIVKDGIGGLTMSALVERSGASRPVVYEHFKNSEAVAVALVDQFFQETARFVVPRVDKSETIFEYMDVLIDALFEYRKADEFHAYLMTNGHSSAMPELNRVSLLYKQRAIDIFSSLLEGQGVEPELCKGAGYGLHELVTNTVYAFGASDDASQAKRALKIMVAGSLRALVTGPGTRPITPSELIKPLA